MVSLPPDVIEHVRLVFTSCNAATSRKLTMNPNVQEEALDLAWIDHVMSHTTPLQTASGWFVKIEAHYLGGLRHYDNFEIADIGVLVHYRLGSELDKSKVVLLQSKRLYPTAGPVRVDALADYTIGFARLADPEDARLSMSLSRRFRFSDRSRYGAIQRGSGQIGRIDQFERSCRVPVYYHLYNPWRLPYELEVPISVYAPPVGEPELGVRVIPASIMHPIVADTSTQSPAVADIRTLGALPRHGWRLEDFVCDQVLPCREGREFQSLADDGIEALFYRRSGPIAAAIAITIEAPEFAEERRG